MSETSISASLSFGIFYGKENDHSFGSWSWFLISLTSILDLNSVYLYTSFVNQRCYYGNRVHRTLSMELYAFIILLIRFNSFLDFLVSYFVSLFTVETAPWLRILIRSFFSYQEIMTYVYFIRSRTVLHPKRPVWPRFDLQGHLRTLLCHI